MRFKITNSVGRHFKQFTYFVFLMLLWAVQTDSAKTAFGMDIASIPNVDTSQYHFTDTRNKAVYVVRRIGYNGDPDDAWTDELWRYHNNTGEKLFSAKGLEFRIFPEANLGVITHGENIVGKNMVFIQLDSKKIIKRFEAKNFITGEAEETHHIDLSMLSCLSRDNTYFWSCLAITYYPEDTIFRLNIKNWGINKFNIKDLVLGEYFQIEPDSGVLTYTDEPTFFDADDYQQWQKKHPVITTYTYNLFTGEKKIINKKAVINSHAHKTSVLQ